MRHNPTCADLNERHRHVVLRLAAECPESAGADLLRVAMGGLGLVLLRVDDNGEAERRRWF